MGFDLLLFLAPVLQLMPSVPKAQKKIKLAQRLAYTGIALALYLCCTLMPLYGVKRFSQSDAMYHLRVITASSRFTLMDLGISPIVSSGMILQFLSSFGLFKKDPKDQKSVALFDAAQKLAGLVMTAFQALSSLLSGQYGNREDIGIFGMFMIVLQLLVMGVVLILLDELLQNGYGIGSGTSLFIATNICEQIVWKMFSFQTEKYGKGKEYEGAFVAFFYLLVTRKDKVRALREAMFRAHLPNLLNLFSTILVFISVLFFEHIKINLSLENEYQRGDAKPLEIKLFYTSTTPIIVQSTIISQMCSFSKLISHHWPESIVSKILGVWRAQDQGLSDEYARPVSGLVYYLQAPTSIRQTLQDPFHTFIYLILSLSSAGLIAFYYLRFGGNGPADVAKSLVSQKMKFKGKRLDEPKMRQELEKYIPITAAIGGILTGLLSFVADFLGAFGSGTGIILAVSIIFQFAEELTKEAIDSGHALLAALTA